MKRRHRFLYGWLRGPSEWCLSREPPDIPVRHQQFASLQEAEQAAKTSRYEVIWCGAAAAMREQMISSG